MATLAARQAASRFSSSKSYASFIHRRGFADSADQHALPRVNCWQEPLSPAKWKEEHFVFASLSGWGLLFYSGYKFFTSGKPNKEEKLIEAAH